MLAGGIAWALAHTLARGAHIRVDVWVNRLPLRFRAALHLFALLLLGGFAVFCAWAAWSLVDESLLFDAHDNSALRVPLVLPQGVWLFGLLAFCAAILVLALDAVLLLLGGRTEEVDRLLGSRSLQDETAEALDAVAMARGRGGARRRVIAVLVLLLLLGASLLAMATGGQEVPIGAILGADGGVRGVLRRRRPCGGGAGAARHAGRAGVLRPALVGFRGADALGAVLQLRAGGGAAVPADGRDPAAGRAVGSALPGAEPVAEPAAGRAAAHQHRVLRGVLRHLRELGGDGGDHGLGGAALLHRLRLQPAHGARLARGGRGARQPDPAGDHLHRLRADHRDLGRRALHGGAAAGRAGDGAVHPGDPPARRWRGRWSGRRRCRSRSSCGRCSTCCRRWR